MDGKPLHFTLRELRSLYTSPPVLGGMAIVSVILGLAGPFDTYDDFSVPLRIVYWAAIVFVTYGVGNAVALLVARLLTNRVRQPLLLAALAGAAGGPAITVSVLLINLAAYGRTAIDPLPLLAYCTAISIGVTMISTLLSRPDRIAVPEVVSVEAAPVETVPILERIPHPQRGRLLALSVSDHYVEVLTERGRSLVLMRLSDAIRETGGIAGLQIHRSHWVALDAVTRVLRSAGKVQVELTTGQKLPVSRGYLPAARAAGLVV